MRGAAAFVALVTVAAPGAAQWRGDQDIPAVRLPAIPTSAATANEFVPKDWTVVQSVRGDLNADGKPDVAKVLRMTDPANRIAPSWAPETRYDTNPWMLVVALAAPNGFRRVVANGTLIPRHENPNADDEFEDVKVERGTLKVVLRRFLSAGGWEMGNTAFTFRWQDGGFRLIGFDRDSVRRNTGEMVETSINYLTATKITRTGTIESDTATTRRARLPKRPLVKLEAIGDGLMWDPNGR